MFPRPNLGGNSILFSALVHSVEAYSPSRCAHNGDSIRDREFDSNVFYFLILIKVCSILVCPHFTQLFCPFTSVYDKWEDKYTPFEPKSFKVHPTNSQSMPLPMMGFEYVNGLPLIHKGPFRPSVGIMAHLVVSDLLIHPLTLGSLPKLKEVLNLINKRVPFISLVCSTIHLVFT